MKRDRFAIPEDGLDDADAVEFTVSGFSRPDSMLTYRGAPVAGATWHTYAFDYSQAAPIAPEVEFADAQAGYATVRGGLKRTDRARVHRLIARRYVAVRLADWADRLRRRRRAWTGIAVTIPQPST